MRPSAPGRQAGRLVGALAAFLALVVVWTPSADASCGPHWLTSRGEAHRELTRLLLLDPAADTLAGSHPMPPKAPARCSGAFCSGNPAAPASATPSLVSVGGEQWAMSSRLDAAADRGSLLFAATDTPLRPVDRAQAIFHPPPHLPFLEA